MYNTNVSLNSINNNISFIHFVACCTYFNDTVVLRIGFPSHGLGILSRQNTNKSEFFMRRMRYVETKKGMVQGFSVFL